MPPLMWRTRREISLEADSRANTQRWKRQEGTWTLQLLVGYNRQIKYLSSMRSLLGAVSVLSVNMAGASATPPARVEQSTPAPPPAAVSMDLDGDGSSDIAMVDVQGLRLRLSRRGQLILDARSAISALAANDLDRDGDRDLVALSRRGTLLVWRNDGAGRFSYQPPRFSASGSAAEWSRGRMNTGAGTPGTATSTEGRSLDARTAQAARVHALDRAGPIVSATTGLQPPSTTGPGSPRSPPLC